MDEWRREERTSVSRKTGSILCFLVAATVLCGRTATGGELELAAERIVQAGGVDLTVIDYSVPSMGDWNNDPLPDLIVGEGSGNNPTGRVRVYVNVGTPGAPLFAGFVYAQSNGADLVVAGAGCLGAFPRMTDWNGDGKDDLLVGRADGKVNFYENTSSDPAAPTFGTGVPLQAGAPGAKADIDVGAARSADNR